jgi:hypothetical protein
VPTSDLFNLRAFAVSSFWLIPKTTLFGTG